MNNTTKLATIDRVLGGVPQFQCVEGCHDCCGPVGMSRLELLRIVKVSGLSEKELTRGMLKAVEDALGPDPSHAGCPLLDAQGKCSVYSVRPAVCRVFGASTHELLICPHGRKPETPLTPLETDVIMGKVDALGM